MGGGPQRPGGAVSSERHKPEALKGPRSPQGPGPAIPTPTALQEDDSAGRGKRDPPLSAGAGFLSAREVSNVRSPPPRIPSGGQASHFPFRKGQNKRPVEHIKGKSRSGPSPGSASCSSRPWPSPLGEVQDACRLTWPVCVRSWARFYSLIHLTDIPPTCSVPGSVPGAGVLASRVLCYLGEKWTSHRSSQ